MVANILPAEPLLPPPPPPHTHTHTHTLGMGSKGQNSIFSEHGHDAYQIKENHECSNMVANILLAEPPTAPSPPYRSKFNFFITWSCRNSN